MTQDEAQAEAVRRWGENAYAEEKRAGLFDVGIVINKDIKELYGWGSTWEEALALAEQRKHIYERTNQNYSPRSEAERDPPEHTAEPSQEITQLRLFP